MIGQAYADMNPQDLWRRRQIIDALRAQSVSGTPANLGQGIAAIGQALFGSIGDRRISPHEQTARERAAAELAAIMGGGSPTASMGAMPQSMPQAMPQAMPQPAPQAMQQAPMAPPMPQGAPVGAMPPMQPPPMRQVPQGLPQQPPMRPPMGMDTGAPLQANMQPPMPPMQAPPQGLPPGVMPSDVTGAFSRSFPPRGAAGAPITAMQGRMAGAGDAMVRGDTGQDSLTPDWLVQSESGGNWNALNNERGAGGARGHGGRLQFGAARLQDAARAGVIAPMSPQQFAQQPPEVQQRVEQWHFRDIDAQAQRMGLSQYIGQTVGGVQITPESIRSMAHLGGIGGAARFIQSGGQYNPADSFGTRLSDYGARAMTGGGGSATMIGQAGGDTLGGDAFGLNPEAIAQLAELMGNPYLGTGQQAVAQALLGRAMEAPRGAEPTSFMQNYEFLLSQGLQPEQAMDALGQGMTVNVEGDAAGPNIGTVPQGYSAIPDPSNPSGFRMEPIPGGPEDTTAQEAAAASSNDTATRVITTAAQRAREAAEERSVRGGLGALAAYNPSSRNAEVYRQVDVLKSNATIENLQAMRAESPTGGALGSVTASENAMLAAKAGALDPASPTFLRDLDDYELTLLQTIHGDAAGRAIYDQTRAAPPPGTDGMSAEDAAYLQSIGVTP